MQAVESVSYPPPAASPTRRRDAASTLSLAPLALRLRRKTPERDEHVQPPLVGRRLGLHMCGWGRSAAVGVASHIVMLNRRQHASVGVTVSFACHQVEDGSRPLVAALHHLHHCSCGDPPPLQCEIPSITICEVVTAQPSLSSGGEGGEATACESSDRS